MTWEERITVDPNIVVGKPIIKGTRLTVEFIVGLMANGWTVEQIIEDYPGIEEADIRACLRYASESLELVRVFPLSA